MNSSVQWHTLSAEAIAERLRTDPEKGLARDEAAKRLLEGKNSLPEPVRPSFAKKLLLQFSSPITFVLVLAALATLFLADFTDALVIAVALLVNVVMGMVQEGRASRAFEALKGSEATFAVVFRDGEPMKIPAEELVTGDLVVLSSGSAVPADLRIIEVHGLTVNESALSGEWVPVEKGTDIVPEEASLDARNGMAYAGTLVVSGAGKGLVVATGSGTEIGLIAMELAKRDESVTPLMRDIRQVARVILIAVAVVMVGIIGLGLLRGLPFDETLFTAIALAVASVPEGLPAAVTVVLALGMERILKSGGLVRNLLAAETLGTTSIILTDKTGTLTEGRMTLESLIGMSATHTDAEGGEPRELLRAAVLASNAYVEERPELEGDEKLVVHGRPIEQAIVLAGLKNGIAQHSCLIERPRTDELHFDSSRRFGGMLVLEDEAKHVAYLTGAPELIVNAVSHVSDGKGERHELTGANRLYFASALASAARDGKRVIAVARVDHADPDFPMEQHLSDFLAKGTLLGLLVFSDVIRPEAASAIAEMHDAGARVLMLTGDNPETALSIARMVGIAGPEERAYTGAELSALTDEEMLTVLQEHTVFARVAPAEKLRIAEVLKGAGEVVAMTGDGVNDAPALRAAAIGIALGSGTDVAKEASDLVLLNNGFSVITVAIREGRRLRENFKKIFAYMLSTNFSEVALIGFSLIVGLPLPILPTQILWSNLIEGGLMNFAFAFEPLYPASMKRKPKDPEIARVLSPKLIQLIALVGTITSALLIGMYLFLLQTDLTHPEIQTLMFVAVSVNCIFMAFSMKSLATPIWKLPLFSNLFLVGALVASTLMLLAALYVPMLQMLVHVTPPSMLQMGIFFGFGLVNLATIEVAKWIIFIRARREA
ncbi:MAG: cadmium-translocating P-type ATPase [Parcubacteria bacterium C7867-004]|nr:MAG: cadmium-translocating P-type ATPase [Parcubacteria bacterium C7867-004]